MSSELITISELYSDLKSVAAQWLTVGIQLGVPKGELDSIKACVAGVNSRVENCFIEVISTWLTGPKENITVDILAEAVRKAGFGGLADDLLADKAKLKLNMKTVTGKLKPCKSQYSTIGIHLKVSFADIKKFEAVRGNVTVCLLHTLEYYLANNEPSVSDICEALESAGRKDISEIVTAKYNGRQFQRES